MPAASSLRSELTKRAKLIKGLEVVRDAEHESCRRILFSTPHSFKPSGVAVTANRLQRYGGLIRARSNRSQRPRVPASFQHLDVTILNCLLAVPPRPQSVPVYHIENTTRSLRKSPATPTFSIPRSLSNINPHGGSTSLHTSRLNKNNYGGIMHWMVVWVCNPGRLHPSLPHEA